MINVFINWIALYSELDRLFFAKKQTALEKPVILDTCRSLVEEL